MVPSLSLLYGSDVALLSFWKKRKKEAKIEEKRQKEQKCEDRQNNKEDRRDTEEWKKEMNNVSQRIGQRVKTRQRQGGKSRGERNNQPFEKGNWKEVRENTSSQKDREMTISYTVSKRGRVTKTEGKKTYKHWAIQTYLGSGALSAPTWWTAPQDSLTFFYPEDKSPLFSPVHPPHPGPGAGAGGGWFGGGAGSV